MITGPRESTITTPLLKEIRPATIAIPFICFTALDRKEKGTAYKFVKNVYDDHSLRIHTKICSGIDDLPPGINFDLSQSTSFSQSIPQSSQKLKAESALSENERQLDCLRS